MALFYFFTVLAILLSWLFPDHYLPWRAFYNEFLAFSSLLLLLLTQISAEKKTSHLLVVIISAIAFLIFQNLVGVYSFLSDIFFSIAYLAGALVAYQIGISSAKRIEFIFWLAITLALAGTISAIIGLCQWLHIESFWFVKSDRSVGNLAQANNFASLLFWAFCAITYLYTARFASSGTYLLISFILVLGLVLSESRTPILFAIFFLAWLIWGVKKQILDKRALLSTAPLLLFALMYGVFPAVDALWNFTEPEQVRLLSGKYANRIEIWKSLTTALLHIPSVGYGMGQVSTAQFTYLSEFAAPTDFVEYSHNIALDLLIWFGPIAGGLVIIFLSWWIGSRFWKVRCLENWFLLACVGGTIIHSNLEYPIAYAYFLLPFSLMLGLIDQSAVKASKIPAPPKLYTFAIFLPAALLMSWVWVEYRILEKDHRIMRGQNFGLPIDPNLRLSENVTLIDGEREYIRFARTKASTGMSQIELNWMKKVAYRFPFEVVVYRYCVALALNGHLEEAIDELRKIEYYYGSKKYEYYKYFFDQSVAEGKEM